MRQYPRRARVNPSSPKAWATSDRSGFIGNHEDLRYQLEWAGTGLINTQWLVYPDEYDQPNRQLGTIILPPDPEPIRNARVEQYAIDEEPISTRTTMDGRTRAINWSTPYLILRVINVRGDIPAS